MMPRCLEILGLMSRLLNTSFYTNLIVSIIVTITVITFINDDSHCRPPVPMLERLVPLSRGALTHYVIVIMIIDYHHRHNDDDN